MKQANGIRNNVPLPIGRIINSLIHTRTTLASVGLLRFRRLALAVCEHDSSRKLDRTWTRSTEDDDGRNVGTSEFRAFAAKEIGRSLDLHDRRCNRIPLGDSGNHRCNNLTIILFHFTFSSSRSWPHTHACGFTSG